MGDDNGLFEGEGEQPVEFLFDYLVAFTDLCFQSLPVQYGDVATVIIDESRLLQFPGGLRDPFAAHAQHTGNHFLGDGQLVRREPVQALQQPAAELLTLSNDGGYRPPSAPSG